MSESQQPAPISAPTSWRGPARRIVLVAIFAVAAAGTTGLLMARLRPGDEPPKTDRPADAPASKELKEFAGQFFPSWGERKPELVIVFSGQQHNYEAPCGCTDPQYGGLERRYNLLAKLRGFGLPTVALDLGDIYLGGKMREQARLKYFMSMKALNLMGYEAINVGPNEFRIPLVEALAETVLNNKYSYQVLAANVANKGEFPADDGSMLKDFRFIEPKGAGLKVGVVGTLGKSVVDGLQKMDPAAKFERNLVAIPAALNAMKAKKPDVKVLLYQGFADEAKLLAQEIDEFDIILCRSEESEPRGLELVEPAKGQAQRPKARLVFVGHKGRYVGVMALFRTAEGGLDLKWEAVRLGPELKTPADEQEKHPIVQLLEEYTTKLKDGDFLGGHEKATHPLQKGRGAGAKFLGSEACKECHKADFAKWEDSRHAGAYETLYEHPKAKPPHNRQFDPECVACHTVGFGYATGFRDNKSGYTDADKAKHLWGVGCETCHGPGGLHAANPKNQDALAALSPWKEKPDDYLTLLSIKEKRTKEEDKKVTAAEQGVADRVFKLCFQCHDTDNDHDFKLEKWLKISHGKGPTVRKK